MSYDELRKGRYSSPHQVYFITTITRERQPLFQDLRLARLLVHELRCLHDNGRLNSLAWVVMPDHLHWLFQLNEGWHLPRVMKTLKARSAIAINRYCGQDGSVWQRAYYDRALRNDEDIRDVARYIVANPLRARLAQNIGDYPHWDCIWL